MPKRPGYQKRYLRQPPWTTFMGENRVRGWAIARTPHEEVPHYWVQDRDGDPLWESLCGFQFATASDLSTLLDLRYDEGIREDCPMCLKRLRRRRRMHRGNGD